MIQKPGITQISYTGNNLYAQGAILPAGLGTADTFEVADQAQTTLLASRDPVIKEVSVGMSGVDTVEDRVQGAAPLQITDAVAASVPYLLTNIKPVQDLHGYANPWPGGGGKNIAYLEQGTLNVSTGEDVPSTTRVRTNYIPIETDVAYIASSQNNGWSIRNGVAYNANKEFLAGGVTPDSSGNFQRSDPNIKYVRFVYSHSDTSEDCTPSDYWYQFEKGTTATAYAPYSNICPIQGWTGCNVYVSPTTNPVDATVYPCTWQDEAGTVYGGTIDVVSGVMAVTLINIPSIGDYATIFYNTGGANPYYYLYQQTGDKAKRLGQQLNSIGLHEVTSMSYSTTDDFAICMADVGYIRIRDTRFTDIPSFRTYYTGVQLVYELNSPVYYQVPAANIQTLDGDQYVWTDCGDDIDIVYNKLP